MQTSVTSKSKRIDINRFTTLSAGKCFLASACVLCVGVYGFVLLSRGLARVLISRNECGYLIS